MSKFRNRIRDLGRAPAGFGFTALARTQHVRHMLVVAEVPDAAAAAAAAEAGVDAVILRGSAAALEGVALANSVLTGVWLDEASGAEVTAAQQAGADFFLFDDGRALASALTPTDIGRVLLLGPDQEAERLRSVAAIDLDAVVVTGEVGAITVRDQLALRRVASLTGAHLMIAASAVPDAATLEAWRDAGAPVVLVSGSAADIRATVQAADAVPAPKRREERATPIIGAPRVSAHDHDDDDDDDDL
ncbi:MAG: hypothetical protein WC273_03480 [Dehalococcoidia bacterium]